MHTHMHIHLHISTDSAFSSPNGTQNELTGDIICVRLVGDGEGGGDEGRRRTIELTMNAKITILDSILITISPAGEIRFTSKFRGRWRHFAPFLAGPPGNYTVAVVPRPQKTESVIFCRKGKLKITLRWMSSSTYNLTLNGAVRS